MNMYTLILSLLLVLLVSCNDKKSDHGKTTEKSASKPASPFIDVPAPIRRNLGLTWATASYQVVRGAHIVPARIEATPTSECQYPSPLTGRISNIVSPGTPVTVGTVLYRLHAVEWTQLCVDIRAARMMGEKAEYFLELASKERDAASAALVVWEQRALALTNPDVGNAPALAEVLRGVAELRGQYQVAQTTWLTAQLAARDQTGHIGSGQAQRHLNQLVSRASSLTGLSGAALDAALLVDGTMTIHAATAGIVSQRMVHEGAFVQSGQDIVSVLDSTAIQAKGLIVQGDLPTVLGRTKAVIRATDLTETWQISAQLRFNPSSDPITGLTTVVAIPDQPQPYPKGVRPGLAVRLELLPAGSTDQEVLSIPVAATIRYGLKTMLFRRNPRNPEQVIMMEADLGVANDRFVEVLSGLAEGDQVVVGGIYQLMLAHGGNTKITGHFHADGTFHDADH